MSSALKRRFSFETVHPIADPAFERELVLQQVAARLARSGVQAEIGESAIELLVSVFQELRTGRTSEGVVVPRPEAVMSTAEAVNVAHAGALEAAFLGDGRVTGAHLARQMQGVVLKDDAEDGRKFKAYVDHIGKERARRGGDWASFHDAARRLRLG
jgi:MoxR-like ATPase